MRIGNGSIYMIVLASTPLIEYSVDYSPPAPRAVLQNGRLGKRRKESFPARNYCEMEIQEH